MFPDAGTGLDQGTVPLAINNSGVITGYYYDSQMIAHGFLRSSDGTVTMFDAPGAGGGYNNGNSGTRPSDINDAGVITGWYVSAQNESLIFGFVRATDGTFVRFNTQPALGSSSTFLEAINASGVTAGFNGNLGFERSPGGHITNFQVPLRLGVIASIPRAQSRVNTW